MRLRVRFQKLGKVRFTSHRDVARMWERAFRRVRLPLAWTGGFSPRPKISFGLALPTGHESLAEYLDLDLVDDASVDVAALPGAFSAALPAFGRLSCCERLTLPSTRRGSSASTNGSNATAPAASPFRSCPPTR